MERGKQHLAARLAETKDVDAATVSGFLLGMTGLGQSCEQCGSLGLAQGLVPLSCLQSSLAVWYLFWCRRVPSCHE